MKKLIIITFIFIYGYSFAQMQNENSGKVVQTYTIADSAKSQQLKISLLEPNNVDWSFFQVIVNNLSTLDTLQIFSGDFTSPEDLKYSFKLEDVNFDNYKDLKILTNIGNSGNEDYEFWIYNAEEKKYIFDNELTELIGCNPSIDDYNKTYTTGGFLGCNSNCWSYSTYKNINDKLLVIQEETQQYTDSLDSKTSKPIFRRYLAKLKDGKLEIVKDITGSLDEIEEEWNK